MVIRSFCYFIVLEYHFDDFDHLDHFDWILWYSVFVFAPET